VISTPSKTPFFDGLSALTVNILFPSHTHESLVEKAEPSLKVGSADRGIALGFRTLGFDFRGKVPITFNVSDKLWVSFLVLILVYINMIYCDGCDTPAG